MKVTVIPVVIGTLGTILKSLEMILEEMKVSGKTETILTTALLRSVRIVRRILETWGDLLSLRL